MVYVGVDLHRKSSHVAVLDEEGVLLSSRRIASRPDEFAGVFGELDVESTQVAFEATYGWGWFADLLIDVGVEAHMAHPLATKAIASARVKNDSVDAKTLAHLLRANLLPEAWIAPREVREARRLVRTRVTMRRISTRLKNQIHAILADYATLPPVTDLFGRAGRGFLAQVELPEIPRGRIDAALRLIDSVDAEVITCDREIRATFHDDDRIRRLLPIPRIGFTTASVIVAEVWDANRFTSARHLCSWAGLTPSEHSSGERTRRGHITKQGSRWLRWALVEAASAARLPSELARFNRRIAQRRGVKIARVALAHRLLTLSYYALISPTGCRSYPIQP